MDKNPQKSMHYIFIVASRFRYANKRSSYSSINNQWVAGQALHGIIQSSNNFNFDPVVAVL